MLRPACLNECICSFPYFFFNHFFHPSLDCHRRSHLFTDGDFAHPHFVIVVQLFLSIHSSFLLSFHWCHCHRRCSFWRFLGANVHFVTVVLAAIQQIRVIFPTFCVVVEFNDVLASVQDVGDRGTLVSPKWKLNHPIACVDSCTSFLYNIGQIS